MLANLVPAAAVIQEAQTLFGIIGRKRFVGCINMLLVKSLKAILKNANKTFLLEYRGG